VDRSVRRERRASAALAGLVFVAVSINVERILQFKGLPKRALQTVLLLLSVVLVSILGLIPNQSHTALGAELLFEALMTTAVIAALARRVVPPASEPRPPPVAACTGPSPASSARSPARSPTPGSCWSRSGASAAGA
jgi:peptidoglycan/LPS O-acetylase OafA/YrhL